MTTRYINRYTAEKVTVIGRFILNKRLMIHYRKDKPQVIEKKSQNGIVISRKVSKFTKPKTVFDRAYLPI